MAKTAVSKAPQAANSASKAPKPAKTPITTMAEPPVATKATPATEVVAKRDAPKKKTPTATKYGLYVHRVLTAHNRGSTISRAAVSSVGQITGVFADLLARRAADMADAVTVSARDILMASGTLLEGDLKARAVAAGTRAVSNFNASQGKEDDKEKEKQKHTAATVRADIIVPPSLIRKGLQAVSKRVSLTAPVMAAGVVQEVMRTLLDGALVKAGEAKAKRVKSRHVALAVAADAALDSLVNGQLHVVLPDGGVIVAPKEGAREQVKEKRTRRGMKVARNIRKLQSGTESQFQKLPFKRWCTAVLEAIGGADCRFSHDFFDVLQTYTEARAVDLFQSAALMTSHSGRQVVQHKDISTVLAIARSVPTKALPNVAAIVEKCASQQHAMRRLSRRAGITGISSSAIQHAQTFLCHHLAAVLNSVAMLATSQRKKVLTVDHIKAGLGMLGISLVV